MWSNVIRIRVLRLNYYTGEKRFNKMFKLFRNANILVGIKYSRDNSLAHRNFSNEPPRPHMEKCKSQFININC